MHAPSTRLLDALVQHSRKMLSWVLQPFIYKLPALGLASSMQVHSAMISAALGGYLELMLELQKYSDATLYVQPDADAEGAHVEGGSLGDYEEVVTDDKTEL